MGYAKLWAFHVRVESRATSITGSSRRQRQAVFQQVALSPRAPGTSAPLAGFPVHGPVIQYPTWPPGDQPGHSDVFGAGQEEGPSRVNPQRASVKMESVADRLPSEPAHQQAGLPLLPDLQGTASGRGDDRSLPREAMDSSGVASQYGERRFSGWQVSARQTSVGRVGAARSGHTFADLDAYDAHFGQSALTHYTATVAPLVESVSSTVTTINEAISHRPPPGQATSVRTGHEVPHSPQLSRPVPGGGDRSEPSTDRAWRARVLGLGGPPVGRRNGAVHAGRRPPRQLGGHAGA